MADEGRVFVVDDEPAVRESLAALLDVSGFDVRCFGSAADFLAWAKPDEAGCLLADVGLPDVSGLALQKKVVESCPGIAVVMITGHADVPMAVEAMKSGAVDFIEKPFAPEALLAAVRRAIEQSRLQERRAAGRDAGATRIASLSVRERQVLAGLVAGQANKVIAHTLSISPRTVEIYRARLMEKMQARSLPELVRLAILAGVVPD